MRRSTFIIPVALFTFVATVTSGAQEKRSDTLLTVEHYLDLQQVGSSHRFSHR